MFFSEEKSPLHSHAQKHESYLRGLWVCVYTVYIDTQTFITVAPVATVSTIAFPSCASLEVRTVATSQQSCLPTKCASGPCPGAKTWGPSLSTRNIHDLDMRPWVRNFKNILLPRTSIVCGPEISKDHVCHHVPSCAIPLGSHSAQF